jgi:hypothetical protein
MAPISRSGSACRAPTKALGYVQIVKELFKRVLGAAHRALRIRVKTRRTASL